MKKSRSVFAVVVLAIGCAGSTACAQTTKPDIVSGYEARTYTDAKGDTLQYRLLKPKDYDAGQKYPVVLLLHGAGERGSDNQRHLQHGGKLFTDEKNREAYKCFVVVPQVPKDEYWIVRPRKPATTATATAPAATQPEKAPLDCVRLAVEILDGLEKEFSIDKDRQYVMGLSMGGYGTWQALARWPERFAAAVPICGGGDPKTVERFKHVPIWAWHGAKDNTVKVEQTRVMIEALKKVGSEPKYTELPEAGHNAWNPAFGEPQLLPWLFSHKRAAR